MDIAQNSIAAGANLIKILLICKDGILSFSLSDDGKGMDEEMLKSVTDPFTTSRTTRKVGLGIPLLKQSAEMSGGMLKMQSIKGKGTTVQASFVVDSIDRIPIGSIDETLTSLIMATPEIDYDVTFQSDRAVFELNTVDIKKYLNGVPINNTEVVSWIAKNIREGIKEVFGGVLNEIPS
jgi:hypothetical protein